MKKLLIGGAALLASAAAIAQVAPVQQVQTGPAAKVHTRAEVQAKIARHFAKLDTNRDGSLTKAEADIEAIVQVAHASNAICKLTGTPSRNVWSRPRRANESRLHGRQFACPADQFQPSSVECRGAGGV